MNIDGHDIGVCSWSLQPKDTGDLVGQMKKLGLRHVQLALAPLLFLDDKARHQQLGNLREAGVQITATMINYPGEDYSSIAVIRDTGGLVPEKDFALRRKMTMEAGRMTAELGVKGLTTHVGFIPASNHPSYLGIVGRIRDVALELGAMGVDLLMETGQERDTELLQFLNDLAARNVHVNFDPANMILYGAGDPIEAVETLGRHIGHVHVKDGTLSDQPGVKWGEEVPFGHGQVGARRFLNALNRIDYGGPLAIEREAGNQRLEDVRTAVEVLKQTSAGSVAGNAGR